MVRRWILLLCVAMLLCALTGCAPSEGGEEPMRVLIIGNSHSIDAFYMLQQVFADQLPEQKVTLGVVHYGGCSISKHVLFAQHDEAVYTYLRDIDGRREVFEYQTMRAILHDQPWDKVIFQAAKTDMDDTLNRSGRRELEKYVSEQLGKPYEKWWHTSWPSPNEEIFFSPAYVSIAPEGYKENLMALYGFDPSNQLAVLTDMAKTHILPDENYTGAVCTGAAIMYAHNVLERPQLELWRDYTHLSDLGRLIAAYSMYAQLTGNAVAQVGIDTIPMETRSLQYQHLGDMTVTQQMKEIIIEAANHALSDPWSVPTK